MKTIDKAQKLNDVRYEIRGVVAREAQRLESAGAQILKLNIGNPARFGFEVPAAMLSAMSAHLKDAQGYSESKGILSAREAIAAQFPGGPVSPDAVIIGNGVSELIVMAMQALLNADEEVLVPMPDYPLWTAAVRLVGGRAVHYRCDERAAWNPDLDDLRAKLSPKTRAVVLINPNNPTGAVYSEETLRSIAQLAEEQGLVVFADEIYDRIVYDGARHIPMATLCSGTLCVTLNGLSKSYRAAGFRVGWMVLSGEQSHAQGFIEGLEMLASMRLCANVPGQYAIAPALADNSIEDLVAPGGRLYEQRTAAHRIFSELEGLSVVKAQGALYQFVRLDTARWGIVDDERFVLDLLREQSILMVHGRAFNWPEPDHFRVVFLPQVSDLEMVGQRLGAFLKNYHQN